MHIIGGDEVADLTSLGEPEGDVSCNMQDMSLMQLEKEWTEATKKLSSDLPTAALVNNFTASQKDVALIRKSQNPQNTDQFEDDSAELVPQRQ